VGPIGDRLKIRKKHCISAVFWQGNGPSCCIYAASAQQGHLGGVNLLAIIAAWTKMPVNIKGHGDRGMP
jgi:hypothetical protein